MCRPSERLRALLAACALCACGSVPAVPGPAPSADLPQSAWAGSQPSLDELRDAAAFDRQARSALAQRLLDRFEAGGDKADLREALRWIARDWDRQDLLREGAVNRVVMAHCARVVLRSYWVCDGGE